MAEFLYLQDFHLSGKNPSSRKDDYYQTMLTKLDEILDIAVKNKVNYIIDGGDFFNSNVVANTIVDDVLDKIEKVGVPWHMLYGNHCMMNCSIENSKATSIKHMFNRSKLVNHLDSIVEDDVIIQGFDYYHNVENDLKEKGLMCKEPKAKFKIAVLHAFVTLKPFLPQVTHVVAKDIKTDFSIVLLAHYHSGWDIKKVGNTDFVNIGCSGRTSINEANNIPQVLLVDTETEELKIIKLKSAKKAEEVFDLEKAKEIKLYESNIEDFIKSLEDTNLQEIDIVDLTEYIAREQNIDKEVTELLVKLLLKFKEESNNE